MHDLEFVPSESVWAGVRQGIAPRKRRRAAAILWWLFPGMVLLGAGVAMYRYSASTGRVAAVVPASGPGKAAGAAGRGVAAVVPANGNGGGGLVNGNGGSGTREGRLAEGKAERENGGSGLMNRAAVGRNAGNEHVGSEAAGGAEGSNLVSGGQSMAEAANAVRKRYRPGLIGGIETRRGIDGPALEWQPVKTAVTGIRRPRHPWTAGFAAGGGAASIYSRTGTGLASAPSSANYNLGYYSAGYSSSTPLNPGIPSTSLVSAYNATAASSKQNKTYVGAGYAYWAGIYGEKLLSARWAVDVGLSVHFYSVRFETTSQALFYAPSTSSLFAATAVTYANSANSYSGGELQTYYNRYYFLEVPATVQWRLNHSRTLPLFWRGGAVLSYLMSSNGLYYNNATGDVAKDNGVVRRTQASAQSGLMAVLPVRGVQIQAGPEIQYALTSMLTTGSGGGHLVYGGMRVTLMR